MQRIKSFFLLISTLSLALCAPAFANKQLVIFGDSYSDNGNTFQASSHTYPGEAYNQGHFSNGPTWAHYFAQMLGFNPTDPIEYRNFAYGKAQITGVQSFQTHVPGAPKPSWSFTVPDLATEINQYLNEGNLAPQQTMYVIFIGTNDVLNFTPTTDNKKNIAFINHLTQKLDESVQRLKYLGAHNIIIINLRALQFSPLAHQIGEKLVKQAVFPDYASYEKQLISMIQTFNQNLNQHYANYNTIRIYDSYAFDTAVIQKIKTDYYAYSWYRNQFQLKEVETPCYANHGNYVDRVERGCHTVWEHFFYDRIHPTTYVHNLMAKDLYRAVT